MGVPVHTEYSEYSSGVAELVNDIMNTDSSNRVSQPQRYNFNYEVALPSANTMQSNNAVSLTYSKCSQEDIESNNNAKAIEKMATYSEEPTQEETRIKA